MTRSDFPGFFLILLLAVALLAPLAALADESPSSSGQVASSAPAASAASADAVAPTEKPSEPGQAAPSSQAAPRKSPAASEPASPLVEPEFLDVKGLAKILESYRDGVVLLNFFATWCPPCRVEIPDLAMVHVANAGRRVAVIGLSVDDTPSQLAFFIRMMGIPYPVYIADRGIVAAYGISSVPHNVLYAKGQLQASAPGVVDALDLQTIVSKFLEGR